MEGKPKFRLQNTISGLLLGSYDFGWGDPLKWGLVCQGSFSHRFDSNFADLLCKNLGFQSAEFIGSKNDFPKNSTEASANFCDLQFIMSGADCSEAANLEECEINDFRKHGGACIYGQSEIYVSCVSDSLAVFGDWSEWSEPSFCDEETEFIQRTRECETESSSLASCEGPWLQFESCPSCNKPEIHDEYNDYYYSNSEPSNYYDTTESPKIRPKRSSEECFCNFTTDGFLDGIQKDNSGSFTGILFAAFGVFLLVGGFGYQKFKQEKIKKNKNEAEKAEEENLVDEKTAETRNELLSA